MNSNTALLIEDTVVHYLGLPASGFLKRRFGDLKRIESAKLAHARRQAFTWLSLYLIGSYADASRRDESVFLPETIYLAENLTITRAQIVEHFLDHPRVRRYLIPNEFNPGHYRLSLSPASATSSDSAPRCGEALVLEAQEATALATNFPAL